MPEKESRDALLPLKVFKLLALVTLVGITTWQCIRNIEEYLKHEAVTTVSKEVSDNLSFPLVTICNYNRWKKSLLSPEDVAVTKAAYDKAYGFESNVTDDSIDVYNFTYEKGWHLLDDYNSYVFTPPRPTTLVWCMFAENFCTSKFFKHRITDYGNCYTFNEDLTPNDVNGSGISLPLIQSHASETIGLDVYVDIEADDYAESIYNNGKPFVGIKVIVHSKNEQPDPNASGVSIGPGFYGTMTLRRTEYNNLPPPEGTCNSEKKLKYFGTYSTSSCETECKIDHVMQNCSCQPHFYFKTNKTCNLEDTVGCSDNVIAAIDQNIRNFCDCPEACKYEEYTTIVSYAPFPSTTFGEDLVEAHVIPSISYMQKSIVGLKVYFSDISSTVITQSPAHTILSTLNDLGGTSGLYVGFSFITLIELAQVVVELAQAHFGKRKNSVTSIKIQNDENPNRSTRQKS